MADRSSPPSQGPRLAPHVQAALGAAAQPKAKRPGPAGARTPAAHVQGAVGVGVQAKPAGPAANRLPPPPVQRTAAPRLPAARPATAAPMVQSRPAQAPPVRPAAPRPQAPQVVQRIKYKDAVLGLDSTEQGVFRDWLNARSPGNGSHSEDTDGLAKALILHPIPDVPVLKKVLTLFDEHRTGAGRHKSTDEDDIASGLYAVLNRSTILTRHSKAKLSLSAVQGSLVFLDDSGFADAHYQDQLSVNPQHDPKQGTYTGARNEWTFKVIHARKIDQTLAFEHGGRIHLRQGASALHIAVHELIHKLSVVDSGNVGSCLCEGLTERIALAVCKEGSVPLSGDYYSSERRLVDQLVNLYQISEDDLMDIYFSDPAPLIKWIKGDLGNSGFLTFKAVKDANTAISTFVSERDQELQRKVTAGTHYKSGAQTYTRIPAALGKSGKSLKAHVEKAISDYPTRIFGWGQSSETSAALTVLGTILNHHPKLYVAVLWYIKRLALKPATVALGSALNTDSKLWTLLRGEFLAWEV
jgi:hypothetical protein